MPCNGTSRRLSIESLETRLLLSVTLPDQILYQAGYSDAGGIPMGFNQELRDYFTVIGGNTDNAGVVQQL